VFPEGRKVGLCLIVLSIAGLIWWTQSKVPLQVLVPSPIRYGIVALTVSAFMALFSEYRQNLKIVHEGRETSDAMHAFARECAARRLPTLTTEQQLEENRWEQHEYSRRFDHHLRDLNDELTRRGVTSHEIAHFFQTRITPTPDSPVDVDGAAFLLKGLTQQVRLAHLWLWRRVPLYFVGYFLLAMILWLTLFIIHHA